MMKIYLAAVLALLSVLTSCFSAYKSVLPRPESPAVPAPVPYTPAEEMYFTQYYKFTTGQGYTRNIERNYYGKQDKMKTEMSKYDIKKGINIENYIKYSKASFFQDDAFNIPSDIKPTAIELFRPLIDSVFQQADKNKPLRAEIIVLGYADESEIPFNSPGYQDLLKRSGKVAFYANEYYNTLSFFRAKEVGDIISDLLANQKEQFKNYNPVVFDILTEGRGIEYPDAKRTYELIDEKRRITKIYWKVYPQ